jgi:hypothetical protein
LFSAHTSAALSPAAPMTEREGGKELHGRVVNSLRSNVAELASIPESLWAQGESCSPGVLHAMGLLYEGTARITAESSPFGVGYVVAEMA